MVPVSRKGDTSTGHESFGPQTITEGSSDVNINGKGAAREGDALSAHASPSQSAPHPGTIASGSGTVNVNGKPLARIGDDVSCGGVVIKGSSNVFAGG